MQYETDIMFPSHSETQSGRIELCAELVAVVVVDDDDDSDIESGF